MNLNYYFKEILIIIIISFNSLKMRNILLFKLQLYFKVKKYKIFMKKYNYYNINFTLPVSATTSNVCVLNSSLSKVQTLEHITFQILKLLFWQNFGEML